MLGFITDGSIPLGPREEKRAMDGEFFTPTSVFVTQGKPRTVR
jgi:hypothetical protein